MSDPHLPPGAQVDWTPDAPVAPRALRDALGTFVTGITVVTARDETGRPVGITVNSFNSVSLDPPLVLWSLGRYSPLLPVFERGQHFAVNVLAADQQALSERFASPLEDKFAGLATVDGLGEVPLLAGCCAWFECATEARHDGGDHLILIGRVLRCSHVEREPLVYHRGQYRQF